MTATKPSERIPPTAGLRVLLAEDEWLIRETIFEELERLECHVVQAGSGDEALNLFEIAPDSFDVIITDVRMPGNLDGVALAHRILALNATIPVIFATGTALDVSRGWEMREGDRVLEKPYSMLMLAETLLEVVTGSRGAPLDRKGVVVVSGHLAPDEDELAYSSPMGMAF